MYLSVGLLPSSRFADRIVGALEEGRKMRRRKDPGSGYQSLNSDSLAEASVIWSGYYKAGRRIDAFRERVGNGRTPMKRSSQYVIAKLGYFSFGLRVLL